MSGYMIQRFDSLGTQTSFTTNAVSGAVVNTLGTTAPNQNRIGVSIYNPSASDPMSLRICQTSVTNTTTIAALPIFAIVAPGTEKFISIGGGLNIWARSTTANAITSAGINEVL